MRDETDAPFGQVEIGDIHIPCRTAVPVADSSFSLQIDAAASCLEVYLLTSQWGRGACKLCVEEYGILEMTEDREQAGDVWQGDFRLFDTARILQTWHHQLPVIKSVSGMYVA